MYSVIVSDGLTKVLWKLAGCDSQSEKHSHILHTEVQLQQKGTRHRTLRQMPGSCCCLGIQSKKRIYMVLDPYTISTPG